MKSIISTLTGCLLKIIPKNNWNEFRIFKNFFYQSIHFDKKNNNNRKEPNQNRFDLLPKLVTIRSSFFVKTCSELWLFGVDFIKAFLLIQLCCLLLVSIYTPRFVQSCNDMQWPWKVQLRKSGHEYVALLGAVWVSSPARFAWKSKSRTKANYCSKTLSNMSSR